MNQEISYQSAALSFSSEAQRAAARQTEEFARKHGLTEYQLWPNAVSTEGASSAEAARIRTIDGLRGIPACSELTTSLLILQKDGQEQYILVCYDSMNRYDPNKIERFLSGKIRRAENINAFGLVNPFIVDINGKPISRVLFDDRLARSDNKMYTNAGTAEATIEFSPDRYCQALQFVQSPQGKRLLVVTDCVQDDQYFYIPGKQKIGIIGGPPTAASGDVPRMVEERFASLFKDPGKVLSLEDAAASLVRLTRPDLHTSTISGADRIWRDGRIPGDIVRSIIAEIEVLIQRGTKTFIVADHYLSAAAAQIRSAFEHKTRFWEMNFLFPTELADEYFEKNQTRNILLLAPQFVIDNAYKGFVDNYKPLLLNEDEQKKLDAIRLQITTSGKSLFTDPNVRKMLQDNYNAIVGAAVKRFDNGQPIHVVLGISQLGILNYYPAKSEVKPVFINPLELCAQRASELAFIKTFELPHWVSTHAEILEDRLAVATELMGAYMSRKAQKAFVAKYKPPEKNYPSADSSAAALRA